MTETVWTGRRAGSWGPEARAHGGAMNMAGIACVRSWAEKALGARSALIIERCDGRTRVALRFTLDGHETGEVEVITLDALRKRRLKGPQLEQALREAYRA